MTSSGASSKYDEGYQWLARARQEQCEGSVKCHKKGRPEGRPFLSQSASEAVEGALAEITPKQHLKSKTFFEHQNLIRHWITSFALVEHDTSMT